MNFNLTEMQQMIVDSARRFVGSETGIDQWRDRRQSENGVDLKLWQAMTELGWLALAVPDDAGGLGGSMEDVALLMMELGKGLVTEPLVSTGILATHIFDKTLEGKTRTTWLGRVATGATRIALAYEDPTAVGLASLTAQALPDGYALNGQKIMVYDAPSADYVIVLAQQDGAPALFIADARAVGISTNCYPLIDASRAADLHFSNVALPMDALLAIGQKAQDILEESLDRARLALVAQAVGAMDATVRITADYSKERQQFGQPIGKFQAIQHLATDMFTAAYQARSALYAGLCAVEAPPEQRCRATSVAKLIAGLSSQTVSRNAIQIHGGYGITDEYAVSHYYRRLLVLEKQYGGNDEHVGLLAQAEMQS